MADLILKYGNGKTVELCQTAYNYGERNGKVAILNADGNNEIISKLETFYNTKLRVDITDRFDDELLFYKAIKLKENGVDAILIDNAHFLSEFDVKQLYLIAKILDIRVICYADRYHDNQELKGAVRLFELANIVKRVDGDHNMDCVSPTSTFIYGAMNSSKTTSLLITGNNYESKGQNVIYVKPFSDRDPLYIKSRVGIERQADIVLHENSTIINQGSTMIVSEDSTISYQNSSRITIILVDEAQFLSPSQIESLIAFAKQNNVKIIFYGLKSDFLTNTFPGSKRLFLVSDSLRKLDTYCVCQGKPLAEFNARTDLQGNFIIEGDQVAIDGQDCQYTSLCSCYIHKIWRYGENYKKLVKQLEREKRY